MIPIFVIICDRLESTRASIKSYHEYIKTPFEVIMVDFGSTYEPTIEYLKRLEQGKIKVYWEKGISNAAHLNRAAVCIQDYFKSHPYSKYVVTDCDVALDDTPGDVLNIYGYFLDTFTKINVAGPMLRMDDIPDHYPLKEKLISGKMGLHKGFHSTAVNTIHHDGKVIKYIFAPIDTTFGMYRAQSQWARLKTGIRVLAPYGARHLDWYVNPTNLTSDQKYYMEHASKQVANWSNLKA